MQIDFTQIAQKNRKLISGRETGRSFRKVLKVEESFHKGEVVTIIVPKTVKVITPSVFMGLLSQELQNFSTIEEVQEVFQFEGASNVTRENFYDAARACIASVH